MIDPELIASLDPETVRALAPVFARHLSAESLPLVARELPADLLREELTRRARAGVRGVCDYCDEPVHWPPCERPDRHQPPEPPSFEQAHPTLQRMFLELLEHTLPDLGPAQQEAIARCLNPRALEAALGRKPDPVVRLDEVELLPESWPSGSARPPVPEDARDLRTLTPGERVDVLLDDGRVVRTFVTHPPEDLSGDGEGWAVWVRGIRNTLTLAQVRSPGGWALP